MNSETNDPAAEAPDDAAPAAEPVEAAKPAKAAAKKAPAKRAPAKKSAAKKAASQPVADWLSSWAKEAPTEDVEALDEPVRAFLATRSDLLPSIRKIVEAETGLDVRTEALKLFVEADAGSTLRNPAKALEAAGA